MMNGVTLRNLWSGDDSEAEQLIINFNGLFFDNDNIIQLYSKRSPSPPEKGARQPHQPCHLDLKINLTFNK